MSVPNQASGNEVDIGRIAGIPIRFSPWYLLLVGIVFWRARHLGVAYGMVVLVAITWSVLLHELGHGLVAKHYGLRPSIVIHAFGGWCERANIADRHKNMRIVWAGPAVSIALALGFWSLGQVTRSFELNLLGVLIQQMAFMNLFWAGFNLLPVVPMDGGRLFQLQLGYHIDAHRADGITYWVGAVVGAIGAALGWIWFESLLIVLFLGLMAYQNAQAAGLHPFKRTFNPKRPGAPAARGGSGFELPPVVAALVGALTAAFVGVSLSVTSANALALVLVPSFVKAGHAPWTVLTAPFVHTAWQPFLYSVLALWFFGRPVWRAYRSDLRFLALYLGALGLGSLVGVFASGLLGHPDALIYGSGAGSVALMVAWARFVVPAPVLPGWRILPRQLAALLLLLDVGVGLAGLVDWTWYVHLAGVVPALLIPPQKLAENVVELFPQGGQDTWH